MFKPNQAHGAQIRACAKWEEEGEQNTRFFLKQEEKQQTNNRISCIKTDSGNYVFDSEGILHEGVKFDQNLYTKQDKDHDSINTFLDNIKSNKVLSDTDANICEGIITPMECSKAVNKMAKNKSPGYDGIPTEFYVTFWNEVCTYLIDSYNESFTHGELSDTQKQIVMSLLFKNMIGVYLRIIDQLVFQTAITRF